MNLRRLVYFLAAAITALLCGFFVFYTIRLLVVTRFLTELRARGQGAYIGAIVFPALAIGFGLLASWSARAARKSKH